MISRFFRENKQSLETEEPSPNSSTVPPGFDTALAVFHEAAKRVPAYKDFLKKNRIDPDKIQTYNDFLQVPPITKENYLTKYPLKDLLLDGSTSDARIISMSSGSSGQPFFWPRGNQSASESAQLHEALFTQNFHTHEKETLVIIAFAMGTWIAGTYTLAAMIELANRGHRIVAIPPGIDKNAIIRILDQLAPQFEQTILMGYPPFVKDVVDAAVDAKVKLSTLNLKTIYAGEIISERWRDYILDKIKARDEYFTTANIYGTADAGLLGNETPVSIFTRRLATKDKALYERLFPETTTLPSLVHYDPSLRFFEEVEGYLILTVNNSLPLVRYKILDQGRLISYPELRSTLKEFGHTLPDRIAQLTQKAYVAIYGRSDTATTFYALNIYPENIKYGLEVPHLQKNTTGKFVIRTLYDDETQEQTLHLYVELKNKVKPDQAIEKNILRCVVKSLKEHNSEYNRLYQELQHKADPIIHLLEYESPEFSIKIKHRWTN